MMQTNRKIIDFGRRLANCLIYREWIRLGYLSDTELDEWFEAMYREIGSRWKHPENVDKTSCSAFQVSAKLLETHGCFSWNGEKRYIRPKDFWSGPLQNKKERSRFPKGPCVYALFCKNDGNPLYVGLSMNLPQRLQSHYMNFDEATGVEAFYFASKDECEIVEGEIIATLQPVGNVARTPTRYPKMTLDEAIASIHRNHPARNHDEGLWAASKVLSDG